MFLLSLISCNDKKDKNEITKTINSIYLKPNPYTNKLLNTHVFSTELNDLIEKSRLVEEMDRARIKHSEYPNDKPLLIEGEIFTSVYEGYSSYLIKDIHIDNNKARAIVSFSNGYYQLNWKDTIDLIQENGWKMDNVEFSGKSNLKATLYSFIAAYKNQ